MAAEAHSTATLRLTVGDLRIVHPIAVPSSPVAAADVVPALQGLVNAVVAAAEAGLVKSGGSISCRKGCGACCRQLVPVSRTEGERLLALVEAMPALVNIRVGSLRGTNGLDSTIAWPFLPKYSRKVRRMSLTLCMRAL